MKKEKDKISCNQKICLLTMEIKHLEKMIDKHKTNPIDRFLGEEIDRLLKEKKALIKYGKS